MKAKRTIGAIAISAAIIIFIAAFCAFNTSDISANGFSYKNSSEFVVTTQSQFEEIISFFPQSFDNKTIRLYCDIDMSAITTLNSPQQFKGKLCGNGYSLRNVSVRLFKAISANAQINDLNVFINGGSVNFFAEKNAGTINNVNLFGVLSVLDYPSSDFNSLEHYCAAMVYENSGTITNCVNACKYVIKSLNSNKTFDWAGFAIQNTASGMIKECAFVGENGFESDSSYNFGGIALNRMQVNTPVGDDEGSGYEISYEFAARGAVEKCAVAMDLSDAGSGAQIDGIGWTSSDKTDCFTALKTSTGLSVTQASPVISWYEGSGNAASPYKITSYADLYKLKVSSIEGALGETDNIVYALTSDMDMKGMDTIPSISGAEYYGGTLRGEFAFINVGNAVFAEEYNLNGENIGFINSPSATVSEEGTDNNVNADRYGYADGSSVEILPTSSDALIGNGSKDNPYIISSASDLKAMDGKEGFAQLNADILINSAYFSQKQHFNISVLAVDLNGNGHSVIGLFDEICDINNGNVYNINFRSYNAEYPVCQENNGNIKSVASFGSVKTAGIAGVNGEDGKITDCVSYASVAEGESAYAFCTENQGETESVSLCQNYGAVTFAFPDGNGAENCINYNSEVQSNGALNKSESCLDIPNIIYYAGEGAQSRETFDYFELKANGFDFADIFGYPIGGGVPEFKSANGEYKQEISAFNTSYKLMTAYTGNDYPRSQAEMYMLRYPNLIEYTQFSWTYNEESFDEENIINAGKYAVSAVFNGNDEYFADSASFNFVVDKAFAPDGVNLEFEEGDFGDLPLTYNGQAQSIDVVAPSNLDELHNSYGYSLTVSSEITDNLGNAVTECRNAGRYTQTIRLTANNYEDMTAVRTIAIDKKEITVTIDDVHLKYNENLNLTGVNVKVSGLEGDDAEKSVTEIFGDSYLSCDYSKGEAIGPYKITFNGTNGNYFCNTVEGGNVTVTAAELPLDGIDFYGATKSSYGEYTAEYIGAKIALSADVPDGVEIEYLNEFPTNAKGTSDYYLISARFSRPDNANYSPITLSVKVFVTKKLLILTAIDGSSNYKEPLSFKGYEAEGYAESDEYTVKNLNVESKLYDKDSDEEIIEEMPGAKEYRVKLSLAAELENYDVTLVDGTYTINSVYLSTLYDNNSVNNGGNTKFDDLKPKEYDGQELSAEQKRELTFFESGVSVSYSTTKDGMPFGGEIINAGNYIITAVVTPVSDGQYYGNYKVTEYTCRVTVSQKTVNVSFGSESYIFTYCTVGFASENNAFDNFPYTVDYNYESVGVQPNFECRDKGNELSEAKDAGQYKLRVTVPESENYKSAYATADLTVLPKEIKVEFESEYTFTGSRVVFALKAGGEIEGVFSGEIAYDVNEFDFTVFGSRLPISVAEYSYVVEPKNRNYTIVGNERKFNILPKHVEVEFGELSVYYGDVGQIDMNGVTYNISRLPDGSLQIVRKNYIVPDMDMEPIDITVIIAGCDATEGDGLQLSNDDILQSVNYRYYLNGRTNKIKISPRVLTVVWRLDNRDDARKEFSFDYNGANHTYRFDYTIRNLAVWDNILEIDDYISRKVTGSGQDIYHVGTYQMCVGISGNDNYLLKESDNEIKITVNKVPLQLFVRDASVMRGEDFQSAGYISAEGMVGNDRNAAISTLKGSKIKIVTGDRSGNPYDKDRATVGDTFTIDVEAEFDDYTPEVMRQGTLTVIANGYSDYSLSGVRVVYDGKNHSVEAVKESPSLQGGTVTFLTANSFSAVGKHEVMATVVYPTGREATLRCFIEILPATPKLIVESESILFRENVSLADEIIRGKAYFNNDVEQTVEGTFEFSGARTLLRGTNEYEVRFVPTDRNNFSNATGTVTIVSAAVDISSFNFNDAQNISFLDEANTTATIIDRVVMSLKPIMNGLKLYRNGAEVDYIVFEKTETVQVTVKLGAETAFDVTISLTYKDVNNPDLVVINAESLKFDGATVSGKTIYVPESGARLSLSETIVNDYSLYINGYKTDEYSIKGTEGEITVMIRMKSAGTGKLVYSEIFKVETVKEPAAEPIIKSKTLYIVIGCGVAGVVVIVAVILIIWKKKNG